MPTHAPGAIVLAAYSPDPELFRRQLISLQAQTVAEWECIVSVDGDVAPVQRLVSEITRDDERFRVVGDGSQLGFYLNFERGVREVSAEAAWVALCDQDDRWNPEKLERLLPHLDEVSLVSGQARLVSYPSGDVLGVTERSDQGAARTVLSNQFTGSMLVFSAELLSLSLPFPRVSSRAAAHDHWLAVVATAFRGTRVVDEALQDYVQHDANVFGDPSRGADKGVLGAARAARDMARRYEGSAGPVALLRTTFWAYVGWRQTMVQMLLARTTSTAEHSVVADAFGRSRRWGAVKPILRAARDDGYVPAAFELHYRASWIAGALSGGRAAVDRVLAQSDD